MTKPVSPEDVMALQRPTEAFLCPISANTFGIEFLRFTIMDYATKNVIFEVGRDLPPPTDMQLDVSSGVDTFRKIKYQFSEDVLRLPAIETQLVFSVGQQEVRDFRMIERHYFREKLIKSFEFMSPFCIPGTTNEWTATYELPALEPELLEDIINHPYETVSDSFYFVGDKLIMHNKAAYQYIREDRAQGKKSYEDKYGSKAPKAAKFKGEKGYDSDDEVSQSKDEAKGFVASAKAGSKDGPWSKDSDYM